ncbi:unnamed protein product [Cylindrotheca closterium]|uniref:Uncharacterized protein n=1 Tax=Cylindrotheca closterium TaxID=2856 RepID=A0AAD2FU30_9STRA|nr:unnamed protein product [Cylindrotheca closterium]
MIDYLLRNRLPKSAELIKMILEKTLLARLGMWGVEILRMDLTGRIESAEWDGDVTSRQNVLESIIQRSEFYGMIQVTSVLELALWKKQKVNTAHLSETKRAVIDREGRRTTCGANVVIPAVLAKIILIGYQLVMLQFQCWIIMHPG